jgi:DNA-binding NtrC family response regulator
MLAAAGSGATLTSPAVATAAGLPSEGLPAGSPGSGPRPASSLKEIVRLETERVEREMIQKALEQTGGNVTQAARQLRISRKSLQTKMKELGLRGKEQ